MSPTICFIHGLNSSHHSFSYLTKELGASSKINYRSHQRLEDSVVEVAQQLPRDVPLILVGHSLGGVIAMLVAMNGTHDVRKVVTMSSPFGGSKFAYWARWWVPEIPVLHDLTPQSAAMRRLAGTTPPCEVLTIVSTSGTLPISSNRNDSVVSVRSQKALPYGKKVEVKANHFEILQHPNAIDLVRTFVQEA